MALPFNDQVLSYRLKWIKPLYECPYCKEPGITIFRKALLSPGMPASCKSCGKPIVVTYRSWIKGALPGAAVMIGAMFFESNLLIYGLSIVGFALMIWLYLLWVPLAKDRVPVEK